MNLKPWTVMNLILWPIIAFWLVQIFCWQVGVVLGISGTVLSVILFGAVILLYRKGVLVIENIPAIPMGMQVMRDVWGSGIVSGGEDPASPRIVGFTGFKTLTPGWAIYLQKLWHNKEGFVEMDPHPFDPPPVDINAVDSLKLPCDVQVTCWVEPTEEAAILFWLTSGVATAESQTAVIEKLVRAHLPVALESVTSDADAYWELEPLLDKKVDGARAYTGADGVIRWRWNPCTTFALNGSSKAKLVKMSEDASRMLTEMLRARFGVIVSVKLQAFGLPAVMAKAKEAELAADSDVTALLKQGGALTQILGSLKAVLGPSDASMLHQFLGDDPSKWQSVLENPEHAKSLAAMVQSQAGGRFIDPITVVAAVMALSIFGQEWLQQLLGGKSQKSSPDKPAGDSEGKPSKKGN